MRVGIDASNIRAGGGLTYLAELLNAARPEVYGIQTVHVWSGASTIARLPRHSWLRAESDPALDGRLLQRLMWQLTKLPRLADERCDALFVPGGLVVRPTKPYVAMSQNLLPFDHRERRRFGLSKPYWRYLILERRQTASFRRAAGVIFLTENARRMITSRTGALRGRTVVIPLGVADGFRRPPRPQRSSAEFDRDHPFRWLYVSIVNLYKHPWHVARAIAKLQAQGLPMALDLVGPAYAPALARLRSTMRQLDPAGEFIRYHGPSPYPEVAAMYHRADGFIFASTCENMPNILTEAMAAGLPIACSDRNPMPEVLGDAGVYFDAEQPESIAEALSALFASPGLRERLAKQAFEKAKRYTWEQCANQTFEFIAQTTATP